MQPQKHDELNFLPRCFCSFSSYSLAGFTDSEDTDHTAAAARTLQSLSNIRSTGIESKQASGAVATYQNNEVSTNNKTPVINSNAQEQQVADQSMSVPPPNMPKVSLYDFLPTQRNYIVGYLQSEVVLTYEQLQFQKGHFDFVHAQKSNMQAYSRML